MHKSPSQLASGGVSPVDSTGGHQHSQRASIISDDIPEDVAASVSTSSIAENHTGDPTVTTGLRVPEPDLDTVHASASTSLLSGEYTDSSNAKQETKVEAPATESATLDRKWTDSWGSALVDILGALAALFFLCKLLRRVRGKFRLTRGCFSHCGLVSIAQWSPDFGAWTKHQSHYPGITDHISNRVRSYPGEATTTHRIIQS